MDNSGWDARYKEKDLVWSAKPNVFLPPLVDPLEVGSALDLACGEGRNAIWLAQNGWEVTGVDFSAVGIDKAKRIARDTEVASEMTWVVADATTYSPDKSFDLVLIFYVHLDASAMVSLFDRAIAALAPGGTLIAIGHALRNLEDGVGGPPYPDILWTEERIEPLVNGLDIASIGEVLRPVDGSETDAIDILVAGTFPS
jgi:SAM-dependent methyltransferase